MFASGAVVKTGTIQAYGGSTAPDGWLICDGSAISRTLYADLFAVIGTTYGAGNGSTTFNLPNGKMPLGETAKCLGNGKTLTLSDGSHQAGFYTASSGNGYFPLLRAALANVNIGTAGSGSGIALSGLGVTPDSSKSGVITDLTTASAVSTAIIKY